MDVTIEKINAAEAAGNEKGRIKIIHNKLVVFRACWADECDFTGFRIFTLHEWEQWQSAVRADTFPYTSGFGSNQDITWDDADEYLRCFTATDITDEQAAVLRAVFPCGFGPFSC